MIRSGVVAPKTLIDRELSLEEGANLLTRMDQFPELVLPSSHRSSFADQHHPANPPATPRGEAMEDKDEIIEMALSDKVPFDMIKQIYGLDENKLKRLMKAELKPGSYRAWRKRI